MVFIDFILCFFVLVFFLLDIVQENGMRGSDGESDQTSGASDDAYTPVKLRSRPHNRLQRRFSEVSTKSPLKAVDTIGNYLK